MKKGILVVSFGTTYKNTREKNIEQLAASIGEAYPDCEIWQAYSSDQVRSILYQRDGIWIPSIKEAFEQMRACAVEYVIVMPTHVIDGVENHKMKTIAAEYRECFPVIRVAGALIEKEENYAVVAKALWDSLKDEAAGKSLVLMGHGSDHQADISYEKMENALREYSGEEIYVATVEGKKTIQDVIEKMNQTQPETAQGKKVLLAPFMLVAGDHAVNDMAGEENSFLTKLVAEGHEVEYILKGLGEYDKIRQIYLDHLQTQDGKFH